MQSSTITAMADKASVASEVFEQSPGLFYLFK
jgi:hypothetical protein